ncbi:MAG: type IV pilus secretin PilQ [Candidatus Omnitrophica bacterium]|nr:type IV pilus secretin PilQ [Candidatus Omnitrophota bacterium]
MGTDKNLMFKVKLAAVVFILILGVASFIAANGVNEMQVEDAGEGNISVEFKDADIHDVFRVLALKGNVSIVSDPEVKGLVTVQITDIPWEKALDVICRTYAYAYEREANIIRVTTLDKQGQENLVTDVFPLNYAKAASVAEAIAEMRSDRGKIKADDRANLIIVTDIPTNIYKIAQVIKRLDSMTPQVSIEAKIVETNMTNSQDLGIKWNASYSAGMSSRPTTFPWPSNSAGETYSNVLPNGDDAATFHPGASSFPLAEASQFSYGILDGSAFNVLLEAIQSRGKTKILSNPRITTLDNEPAEIHVGTDWPIANYTYNEQTDRFVISGWEYKSYGILLKVTPTINQNGYVTLKLHPEISDKQEEIDFQGARVPVLTTQSTDCTVMIKDGNTLVIGGLIKDKVVTTKTKVPLLGDLPILGLLFTHKSEEIIKNDLLIFITPHIVKEETLAKRQEITKALDVQRLVNLGDDDNLVEASTKAKAKEDSFIEGEMFVEQPNKEAIIPAVSPAMTLPAVLPESVMVIDEAAFSPESAAEINKPAAEAQPVTKKQTQVTTPVAAKPVKEKTVEEKADKKDGNKGFFFKK